MFLDHKYLELSIESFFFYVLCEVRDDGYHFLGYFSKDVCTPASKDNKKDHNNLSCIMVLPCFQKGGYGKLIVEMSYALSIKEGKPGTPERPLSDLGHRLYVNYWTRKIIKVLIDCIDNNIQDTTIKHIEVKTGIIEKDINYVLEHNKIRRG